MIPANRPTGIEPLGDMPWGTHICMFYETRNDLLDTLADFFSAGLRNNERCVWAVSEPVTQAAAAQILRRAIPDFSRYVADRAIEILPAREWYLPGNHFDMQKITSGWNMKLSAALAEGYEGLRISGNAFWMATKHWAEFCQYEEELDRSWSGQPFIALCTYSLQDARAADVMDVAKSHQFTLARRRGEWELFETPELKLAKQQILKLKNELEERVTVRTRELVAVNRQLEAENAERERAEAALEKAQSELGRVSRLTSLGVLAASIAHEINQPLTAIVTNSEASLRWLTKGVPDLVEARAALCRIAQDANRASAVIERIRALVTEDKAEYGYVEINDAIHEVIALMRGTLREHRTVVRLVLEPDLPRVVGDRLQLQQVLMNLITNAVEAMTGVNGAPEIIIRSGSNEAGGLLVSVEDRGRGVDADAADHLFEPFVTTKADGMGMGLSIAQTIVEAHGGRICASPASPNGTVIQFSLPGVKGAS
jgi:signal transduction histidine kinase